MTLLIGLCIVGLLIAYISTWLFSWDLIIAEGFLGDVVRLVATIQFPWRFIGQVTFIGIIAVLILGQIPKESHFVRICITACMAIALLECCMAYSNLLSTDYQISEETIEEIEAGTSVDNSYVETGEYLPNDETSQLPGGIEPTSIFGNAKLSDWCIISPIMRSIYIDNTAGGSDIISLPIFYYSKWQIISPADSGITLCDLQGTIGLNIPEGFSGTVILKFVTPAAWVIAYFVSLVTLIALMSYYLWRKHQMRKLKRLETD